MLGISLQCCFLHYLFTICGLLLLSVVRLHSYHQSRNIQEEEKCNYQGVNIYKAAAQQYLLSIPNTGENPDLLKLLQFHVTPQKTVNVIEEMCGTYWDLGVILLQDNKGAIMNTIEREYSNPLDRMKSVLTRWFQGHGLPVTWENLVKSLRQVKLNIIANDIKEGLSRQ